MDDAIDCSAAKLLSAAAAACLSGSGGTKAGTVGFPFVPLTESNCLGSLACTVRDGSAASEVGGLGAVSTKGV